MAGQAVWRGGVALGVVLLLAAPVASQVTDNLATSRLPSENSAGRNLTALDDQSLPLPDGYDCPEDPTARYDACAGARPLPDGSFYEGDFVSDLPHGVGRQKEPDGTTYLGEFRAGERNGLGTLSDRDGNELYSGEWKDGLPEDPAAAYLRRAGLRNLIKALQAELNRNGCGAGAVDGIIGPMTRNAARSALASATAIPLPDDPFSDVRTLYLLLQGLKSAPGVACQS